MIKKIATWFICLHRLVKMYVKIAAIVETHNESLLVLNRRIANAERMIKHRTEISADVHARINHLNHIVLVGRYRNNDYVEIFSIRNDSMDSLVQQLAHMQKYAQVHRIDAPCNYSQVIKRELLKY